MQNLGTKDQATFRSIVRFYETKQYKKGIKAADTILKKNPDHGETLCMKGLALSCLPDKKEEAYELVKKGLTKDLKSHVCWHVLGLLHRQDRNYTDSMKCYTRALANDPTNLQILRDLAVLQIHSRDLPGFAETRRKLAVQKSNNRQNWMGYAIAEHMNKNYEMAKAILESAEQTFKDDTTITAYEASEVAMYKIMLLEESGQLSQALALMNLEEKRITDKFGLLEVKGRLLLYLRRFEEARAVWKKLVGINPEQHAHVLCLLACEERFHGFWPPPPPPGFGDRQANEVSFHRSLHENGCGVWGWLLPAHCYRGTEGASVAAQRRDLVMIGQRRRKNRGDAYQPVRPLTEEEQDQLTEWFTDLTDDHPRSDTLRRLPLYFLSGTRLGRRLDQYLRPKLRKGVPALFRLVKPLYFVPGSGMVELMGALLAHYEDQLVKTGTFGDVPKEAGGGPCTTEEKEKPIAVLFTWALAAQHADFVGETDKALEHIGKAMAHTPTMVELHVFKGKILKHAGALQESYDAFEAARNMDLADRYLNVSACKAMLRCDKMDEAKTTALAFSAEPDSPQRSNLHDMQCAWWECYLGRSFKRQEKIGQCLRQSHHTVKHFQDFVEDQYDFHTYCLRKGTLRSYVQFLRVQDGIYSHKFFRRAAKDAIRTYVALHDKPLEEDKPAEVEMTAAEKKKAKQQQRKAEQKKAAQEEKEKKDGKKKEEDPLGVELLAKPPLEEALKLVEILMTHAALDVHTYVLAYQVDSRRGKVLRCARALLRLLTLVQEDRFHPKLAPLVASFALSVVPKAELSGSVQSVLLSAVGPLFGKETLSGKDEIVSLGKQHVEEAVAAITKTVTSPKQVIAAMQCLEAAERTAEAQTLADQCTVTPDMPLKDLEALVAHVSAQYPSVAAGVKSKCAAAFPRAEVFSA